MEDKEKLGQEQAFPMEQHNGNDLYEIHHGMTKRFYAACAAMQGLLANPNIGNWVSSDKSLQRKQVVETAFSFADAILKQESL